MHLKSGSKIWLDKIKFRLKNPVEKSGWTKSLAGAKSDKKRLFEHLFETLVRMCWGRLAGLHNLNDNRPKNDL